MNALTTNGGRTFAAGTFGSAGTASGPGTQFDALTGGWAGSGIATAADETGAGPFVTTVVPDGSGGWYVGGFFERQVAGSTSVLRHNLMHIDQFGSPDLGFDAQLDGASVNSLAYDSGTNILYVGGQFTQAGGAAHIKLAALNGSTGAEIPAFNPTVSNGNAVSALAISGSTLYAGGDFTDINGSGASIAALDKSTGALVPGFASPNPNGSVVAIAVAGGRVFIGGGFLDIGGNPNTANLGAMTPLGVFVGAFLPQADGQVNALATDGTTLWIGGAFANLAASPAAGLAAVSAAGTGTALAFPQVAGGLATVLSLYYDGTYLYAGGDFLQLGGAPHSYVGRVTAATGAVDTTINSATGGPVYGVAANAATFYAGGGFTNVEPSLREGIAEIDLHNGGLAAFHHAFTGGVVNAVYLSNGILYAGGDFTAVDGNAAHKFSVAINLATDTLVEWPAAGSHFDQPVLAMARGLNNSVLVGGQFAAPRARAADVVEVGQPGAGTPNAWNANIAGGDVNALLVLGGTVYLGGSFTSVLGTGRNGVAAVIGPVPSLDAAWNPNANQPVRAFTSTPEGVPPTKIYAGGDFTAIGGAARNHIAELPPADGVSTGAATGWNPDVDASVRAMTRTTSGLVYAGGDFTAVNGGATTRRYLAAFDPVTGLANGWDPSLSNRVRALLSFLFDERVYAGGDFLSTRWAPAAGLAVWSEPFYVKSGALTIDAPVAGQASRCNGPAFGGSGPYSQVNDWSLDGVAIPGAFGFFSWSPADADIGHQLTCTVILNNMGHTASYTSAPQTVSARPAASGGGGGGGAAPVTATPVSSPAPLPGAGVPPGDIDGQPSPPPPRAGVSIVAEPATGKVLIQLPGRTAFIRLPDAELIPLKSVIDARNGSVLLTAAGKGGSAKFSEGIFKVTQAPGVAPLTTLTLVGGDFKACPPIPKRARATAKRKLKKTSSVRHLWGDGSGNFRTVGRYASATLRGTRWLTDDRCDGTLVRVAKGRVSVRDLVKKKTVALKAPKSYVARP